MADKILTLTQESTGDNVYPNVKEENLPTEWVKTLVDKEYLTTNYYNKAYIDNNLYTKAYQDVYFLTKDSAEKTYATITSVNTISKKVDSLDTLAHQTDEDLQQYKAITYTKTDIDDNFISIATALTNEDLDTLKTEGSYYAGGNNTCTNKPTGIDAFGLTIKRVASGYYTQYLTSGNTNTGQVYTRTFTSGAWTSWVKFTQDTQLSAYETKADITNKLKGYEKTLNLGTLTATGNSLLDILSTYFTDNNQCLLAFNSEGFIDTTTNLLSGSMVAFAQGDSDCYILSNGLIYKFNGTTATLISQDRLVSGTNIKTINGNSILGNGDLTIESESVSPTLILFNPTTSKNRTTITEQEKINLEKGLYNQIVYNGEYNNQWLFPTKLFYFGGDVGFTSFSDDMSDETDILKELIFNFLEIGKKDSDGNYPITITPASKTSVPGYIPTLSTIVSSLSVLPTTIYSDNDINLIKQQKNNFIKLPIGNTNNYTCELCYVYYDNINYILVDIAGEQLILSNGLSNSPNFLFFKLDETNKKLVGTFFSSLSSEDVKTISLFGNHSILVPKDSTDTNIDLYNHAIEISGTTSGNYDYSIWFNVVSSKNLVVDSLTDLKTLLGNTFKREVFGFSNTSTTPTAIIGIDETQMYNTNGETTSFANLSSITFTDTVTTI